MEIKKEFKDLIPPLTSDEYKQLETNIISDGCRDSIIIWNGYIIDGHNRFEICTKNNIIFNSINKDFESEAEVKKWIIENQFGRRNLSNYQRSILALEYESLFKEKAKENLKLGGGDKKSPLQKSANPITEKINTREEVSKIAGVSHDTIAKVKVIQQKATPEIKEKLQNDKISINEAYTGITREEKKQKQKQRFVELEKKELKPTTDRYDVIVIDPAWQMEKIQREVAPLQVGFDYPTMTIDEIKQFKLPAEKNCHVFMWITQKHLPFGFDIFESWGVKYVLTFVWHKNGGFQPFGLPQYNCEFILYGRIGTPEFFDLKNFNTCFNADRNGHSVKPDEFYEMIKRVTAGKRIDIFNRRKINGYDTYGNEAK